MTGPRSRTVYVNQDDFWSLEVEDDAGTYWLSIPVSLSAAVDSSEDYQLDRETYERFRADPATAGDFLTRARNRELDHLLRHPPPRRRGTPW